MGSSVAHPKIAGVLSSGDTVVNFKRTQLDLKKPEAKPPEIKRISDAGVMCYAKRFGFAKLDDLDDLYKRLEELNSMESRGRLPAVRELELERLRKEFEPWKDIVSYAYWAMRGQENKEAEEKTKIPKPTYWQNKLAFQPSFIKTVLGAHSDYFKPDIDSGDLNKKMHRQLRDGLREEGLLVDRNTSNGDVLIAIVEKIRKLEVKTI